MKNSFVLVLLFSVMLIGAALTQAAAPATGDAGFCSSKCGLRCEKSGRPKLCLRYCGICCGKCNCVPSGTYGNKSECPCYANILNSKGNSKCP